MHASKAARDADERSDRRKTLLPRLANSRDWRQWAFKTETILRQKEIWYVIENAAPAREVVALSANDTARLRGQRQAQLAYETELKNQDMHSWGDEDYPCLSLPAIPATRTETDEEWQQRNLQYFTDSSTVFTEIVNCAEDEALILLQRLESGNGKVAWDALNHRYASKTHASQMQVIEAIFQCKQTEDIEEHVSMWRNLMLQSAQQGMVFHNMLESHMFMRTLRPSFRAYCTIKRTQGFTDPQDVYDGAIEYSKTNNTDEANTTDAALWARQYQTTEMRKCRYGDKCRRWARGECKFGHTGTPPRNPEATRKTQGGGKSRGWNCQKCDKFNFGFRRNCIQCKAPKSTDRGTKRTKETAAVAELQKTVAKQQKQLKALAKKTKTRDDDDEDYNFVAQEVTNAADDEYWQEKALSSSDTVIFKVDSGATSNFGNEDVGGQHETKCNVIVEQADGTPIHVNKKVKFNGITSDNRQISFVVKKSDSFTQNLFSPHQAARKGCSVMLDDTDSYILNKATGNKIPLQRTPSGWELRLKSTEN